MKEKMKKYAKKYVDKERHRLAQEYYSPPGYQQHAFQGTDLDDEDEDADDEYYADAESNHQVSIG
jgi:predicted chitinase